jgi:hypothetical protein
MKRRIRLLVLALTLILLAGMSLACNNDNKKTPPDDGGNTEPHPASGMLLHGFESDRELLSMIFSSIWGKVEVVSGADYVTEGKHAAKMTFLGTKDLTNGYFLESSFFIVPGNQYLEKTDYSDVVKYTLDVYNACDRAVQLMFGYNHQRTSADTFLFGYRTLQKGMNHLEYEVDRGATEYFTDISTIKSFSFYIEGRGAEETPTELYFDNFRAVTTADEYASYSIQDKIDFSNPLGSNLFVEYGTTSSVFNRPRYSTNKNLNYVLTGRTSLEIIFNKNRLGTAIDAPGLRTKDDMFGNWGTYDPDTTYISYDLYNDTDEYLTVALSAYSRINESYTKNVVVAPRSWSVHAETRILLRTLDDAFLGDGLDIFTITFYFTGLKEAGSRLFLDNLTIEHTA